VIRTLNPFDLARYLVGRSRDRGNRVYPLHRLGTDLGARWTILDAARLSLSLDRRRFCSVVSTQNRAVTGMASAGQRSGPRSWEMTHLLLSEERASECSGLLGEICRRVALRGGERVFLRLLSDAPVLDEARMCGFLPCSREVLYSGRPRASNSHRQLDMREKQKADDYDLFRLYNATNPPEIRSAYGMTFDQWSSSRETPSGRTEEFVFERDGQVRGWLRTFRKPGRGQLEIAVHPDEEAESGALLDYGLEHLAGARSILCLVEERHVLVQRLLSQKGFDLVSEHTVLVRSMATTVKEEKAQRAVTIA
jgi:hypothetical protein